jgi:hypothetical protein
VGDKVWICDDEGSSRFPVFTRGSAGEAFGVVASPLTWTTYGRHAYGLGYRGTLSRWGVHAGRVQAARHVRGDRLLRRLRLSQRLVARVIAVRIPGMTGGALSADRAYVECPQGGIALTPQARVCVRTRDAPLRAELRDG